MCTVMPVHIAKNMYLPVHIFSYVYCQKKNLKNYFLGVHTATFLYWQVHIFSYVYCFQFFSFKLEN